MMQSVVLSVAICVLYFSKAHSLTKTINSKTQTLKNHHRSFSVAFFLFEKLGVLITLKALKT